MLFQPSKTTCFRYEWANRDINAVEWENIPNSSSLDDLMTPLRLLGAFFATH